MKKEWSVQVPITGFVLVIVEAEAETEEEAVQKALEVYVTKVDIEEWATCEQIVTGNVFNGVINKASAAEEF